MALLNSNYQILTPTGFQDFYGVKITKKKKFLRLEFSNGESLICTLRHKLIKPDFTEKMANRCKIGEKILSIDGVELEVVNKIEINQQSHDLFYDAINVSNGNLYNTGPVVSHNCEFLSSDSLLIDPIKLSQIRESLPVFQENEYDFYISNEELIRTPIFLVGVDPATGSGGDNSVIQVFSFPDLVQVAEFKTNTLKINFLYNKITWILSKLTSLRSPHGHKPEVFWSFERNSIGEAIAALYFNDANQNEEAELISDDKKSGKLGMYTTNKNKVLSALKLKTMIEKVNNGLKINSGYLLFELKNYACKGASYEAKTGATDDAVSACLVIIKLLDYLAKFNDDAHSKVYDYNEANDAEIEPMPFAIV